MNDSRLVYSTDGGDRRRPAAPPQRGRPAPRSVALPTDGVVRVRRETGGRGGKEVTVVHGLPGGEAELKALVADLKKACGTGGTARDGIVELQGDQRARVLPLLEARGFRVKLAGG